MKNNQEVAELFQEIQATEEGEAGIDPAAGDSLSLKSDAATTTTTIQEVPFAATVSSSLKRRSPPHSSSFQEPSPKRAAATVYAPTFAADVTATIPPPHPPRSSLPSTSMKPNIIRRSTSDIAALTDALNSVSSPNSIKTNADLSASASPAEVGTLLPPSPPVTLRRSLSSPTSYFQPPSATSSPLRPQAARTFKETSLSSDQESHKSKEMKRIAKKLKEMSQWVEKVMSEEDDQETFSKENDNSEYHSKEQSENEADKQQAKEAAWVEERNGEALVLHFKCSCANDYEIFLLGNNCYYKIM